MRRPRSGIGAELVPLVLILACLAGSLGLIVVVHRRASVRPKPGPTVAVALPPAPAPAPEARPAPASVVEPESPEPVPVPEPPAPPLEDPTPKALAKLTSAEAEQLLEASRADRKAAALEEARKSALIESERWRRRESLVNAQLSTLETKVRKLESQADDLAFERDALLREIDSRKAAVAQTRSRPAQAILPHKGPNGTWRRPIVVECTNGMAILQPQGVGFGLLELASGFGPSSNPFVAAVAREAVRVRRNQSPDGAPVVPYIFFLVRPDGVRPYYEARGRLEPLGITFGYELADQDWEVEFPDLDNTETWDGKLSNRPPSIDPRAGIPGQSPAEDDNFPNWGTPPRGNSRTVGEADSDFTWPGQKALARTGVAGGPRPVGLPNTGPGDRPTSGDYPDGGPRGSSEIPGGLPGGSGVERARQGRPGEPSTFPGDAAPGEFPIDLTPPPAFAGRGVSPDPGASIQGRSASPGRTSTPGGTALEAGKPEGDPGSDFIWPAGPQGGGQDRSRPPADSRKLVAPSGVGPTSVLPATPGHDGSGPTEVGTSRQDPGAGTIRKPNQVPAPTDSPDQGQPTIHRGPFTRPLAMGVQVPPSSGDPASAGIDGDPSGLGDSSGNQGSGGGQPARRMIGRAGASGTQQPSGQPPQAASGIGIGMPSAGSPPSGSLSSSSPPSSPHSGSPTLPDLDTSRIIDRRFEIVVVCGPRGVIVQPGGYRVTAEALKDRDGLLKKQMVALVKARRAADPKVILEPKVRFLVQSGGSKTYWAARSQVLLSGLDWPMTTQVADPDSLSILPSEGW